MIFVKIKFSKIFLGYCVSILTEDTSGYIPHPDMHLSLFSGSIWPQFLQNFFMLDVHRNKSNYDELTLDRLLDDQKETKRSLEKLENQ